MRPLTDACCDPPTSAALRPDHANHAWSVVDAAAHAPAKDLAGTRGAEIVSSPLPRHTLPLRRGLASLLAASALAALTAGEVQAATLNTLISFNLANGADPYAGLIADAAGNLFGTTEAGGANRVGTVFEIIRTNGVYAAAPSTLVSFNRTNGRNPWAGVIADAAGNLFGTTVGGGAIYDGGTVFEVKKTNGVYDSAPTTLVGFTSAHPIAGLLADGKGTLFGATQSEGASNNGMVFEIKKTNGVYDSAPTVLASFNGTDGASPAGGLIADAAGNLFGTTSAGGANSVGTVFEIKKIKGTYASTPIVLVSFNGTDGSNPQASLLADAAGNLFGTTQAGGSGYGTVFEIKKTNGTYASTPTVLVSFNGTDGANSRSSLLADAEGNLFGTTVGGGAYGQGTVFEITSSGFIVFAGTPRRLGCVLISDAALIREYRRLSAAAYALGYPGVLPLERAILAYCAG